ncbi:hypothetical protein Pse7367_3831 (plasmid) [Thalassoporum mexicanum PCC 7367]|uniref:hypothetical protein n=1 Tax=Thalassoporum mexicanum TaxID=3457544 RepID=UPI00029FF607|nr:hypothetical protein [Pseudanabaena sp. PCC 7367]AFY72054.1 hypothetical protein Pse7367_3831 [Pseudanabaena sp. PCC 7367]
MPANAQSQPDRWNDDFNNFNHLHNDLDGGADPEADPEVEVESNFKSNLESNRGFKQADLNQGDRPLSLSNSAIVNAEIVSQLTNSNELTEAELQSPLSVAERQRLHKYEQMIRQNIIEIGLALLDIQESRLYRETHANFEAYAFEQFGISKTYAYGKIAAAKVIKNLTGVAPMLPQNERQCRPLAGLDAQQQRLAWQEVLATGDRITGKLVKEIVAKYQERSKPASLPMSEPDRAGGLEPNSGLEPITIDIDPDLAISQDNHLTNQLAEQPTIQTGISSTAQPANQRELLNARANFKKLSANERRQIQIKQQQKIRQLMETLFTRCTPAMSKLVHRKLEQYFYQFVPDQDLSS